MVGTGNTTSTAVTVTACDDDAASDAVAGPKKAVVAAAAPKPEDYGICSTESALKAARFAARAAQKMAQHSDVMDRKKEEQVARLAMREIRLGKRLGRGGFSDVYEVLGVDLDKDSEKAYLGAEMEAASTSDRARFGMSPDEIDSNIKYQSDARDFIRMHFLRTRGDSQGDLSKHSERSLSQADDSMHTGDARYAVKFLRKEVMREPRRYRIGAADLVVEAKFLSCLVHPNIVKIRAVTADGVRAFATGMEGAYFILMDRLYDTLEARIHNCWKKEAKKYKGLIKGQIKDRKGDKRKDLLIRRLTVAFDVAGALRYLHDMNIIYRDLKPENLGFDVRGDIRLFDFGLAKQLDESERVGGVEGTTYEMSGNTGSLRYMSPEVAKSKPYNLSADVYSFGTMLWEILALSKPYDGFNREMHAEMVVSQGVRPSIPPSWPVELKSLVQRAWSQDMNERPSMEACYYILRKLVIELRGGDDAGLNHSRRRSTFVMPTKKLSVSKRKISGMSASSNSAASRQSIIQRVSIAAHRNSPSSLAAAARAARELDSLNHEQDLQDMKVSKSTARGLGLPEKEPEKSVAELVIEDDDEEEE
mmetsp:Transcript_24350/g.53807  ORF Transcript_24350/g.53807 Transcript_24350/m.53807 type:complete len:590 (+) Transcript_24350:103-1872(+)